MSRMPSVMSGSHDFAVVPSAQIPRSSFDRSRGHKTTMNAGILYPIFCDEVLPGDTYHVNLEGFARLSTPLKPVMDNMYFNTFFFFVPNRLVWNNWAKFNGEQEDPGDSTDYLVPQVLSGVSGFPAGSLYDYMGLPVDVPNIGACSFYPRAYSLIWNEWFRDQNLQDRIPLNKTDASDSVNDFALLRRGKRHDYFTSALPWPQKGESVSIPLGSIAPVVGNGSTPTVRAVGGPDAGTPRELVTAASGSVNVNVGSAWTDATLHQLNWATTGMATDLSEATAATINQLRQAFAVQRLYERDARGGTRYTEVVRAHFGVISPDARLQRPEYLGGGQSPVLVSQVPQTSQSSTESPQGNLAAFGTAALSGGHGFSKSFTEHGVIIGLLSIRADLNYQQGLDRMWSRRSRFDYYWPALSHIGEQAVLSREIYCDGTGDSVAGTGDYSVWGYQERYAEYRYARSMVTAEMRSSFPQSLDVWHLAQDFASRPHLNSAFIEDNPPVDRIVAVPSEPAFIADFFIHCRTARPMPVYGVPGLIDHF